eukprot:367725_1
MSFVWNLPLMPAENRKSLCHGYIRNNYNNHIATHIMGLCSTFYSPSFFTLKDIKNATSFPKYVSPIFTVDEFKCCVQIWPNGCDEAHRGQVLLVLCFLGFPPKIKQVRSKFTLAIAETATWFTREERTFTSSSMSCSWKPSLLKIDNDKLQSTDTLTIVCGIHELVIAEKGKFRRAHTIVPKTSNIYRLSNLSTLSYLWQMDDDISTMDEIHNAPSVYAFASPIFELFGLQWYLTFYPNGSKIKRKGQANVYLHLASVPSSDFSVWIKQRISFHRRVEELILKHSHTTDGHGLSQFVKHEDVVKSNGLCCYVEITLIDILKKDKIITDAFMKRHRSIGTGETRQTNSLCHFDWMVRPIEVIASGVGEQFKSDSFIMFGLTWCLGMDATGKLFLNLLSKKWNETRIVSVRCYIAISELNMRWVLKGIFDKNTFKVDWGEDRISMDELTNFSSCRVLFDMERIMNT